jgi:putative CocE/NonD family hydrolase
MSRPALDPTVSMVVERGLEVPMRDGIVLVADVYRPESGQWPTLICRTPYLREHYPGNFVLMDPLEAVAGGFAVVVQDTRGRGASGGDFRPFDESADGYDTTEWAARQPWSSGQVATYGSSYMGATQIQTAIAAPPSLLAICPIQASSDYYEGRSYQGGAFELGGLISSSLGAMALGPTVQPTHRARIREILGGLENMKVTFPLRDALDGAGAPLRALTPWFFDWAEHTEPDDFWTAISIEGHHAEVQVPALHITSWYDQFHVGTLRNFEALRHENPNTHVRENQYLIVGPWDHYGIRGHALGVSRVGDMSFGPDAALNLDAIQLGWFKRWLTDDPAAFRQKKRVRLFVMGANSWRYEDDWPIAIVEHRALHLAEMEFSDTYSAEGSLSTNPAASGSNSYDYNPLDPVPTLGGAHLVLVPFVPHGPVDQRPIESRPDVLVYTGDALTQDVEIIGQVHAKIYVSSSAPCTDFTVRLVDVYQDGKALSVCDGIQRVRFSKTEASTDGPLVVRVAMGSTAHRFLVGHRIRVDISSSNFPRFDPNPNTGESSLDAKRSEIAHQSIYYGKNSASRVILPVVEIQSRSE